jgi:hypothetical protein
MGSRVLRNGLLVERGGIRLAERGSFSNPSLIWNGESYVASWDVYPDFDIVTLEFRRDLAAKEPPRKIVSSGDRETAPALIDDNGLVVAYQRFASDSAYQGVGRVFAMRSPEPRRRGVRR